MTDYEEVDPPPLVAKPGTRFYLIKLPKDVDLAHLNKRKLQKDGTTGKHTGTITVGTKTYNLSLDTEALSSSTAVRPLVRSQVHGKPTVGPAFAGMLTVEQTFRRLETHTTTADIPITAYRKLQQVPGLQVAFMPRGSTTSIGDLRARKKGAEPVGAASSGKKRKAVDKHDDNSQISNNDGDDNGEESRSSSPKKKKKKDQKDKS